MKTRRRSLPLWVRLSEGLGVAVEYEMTLPYDYARCAGTTHQTCQWCRRREPGREQWQSYIVPPIDTLTGECSSFIEPLPIRYSNNTTPNAEVSRWQRR